MARVGSRPGAIVTSSRRWAALTALTSDGRAAGGDRRRPRAPGPTARRRAPARTARRADSWRSCASQAPQLGVASVVFMSCRAAGSLRGRGGRLVRTRQAAEAVEAPFASWRRHRRGQGVRRTGRPCSDDGSGCGRTVGSASTWESAVRAGLGGGGSRAARLRAWRIGCVGGALAALREKLGAKRRRDRSGRVSISR